jgi:FKBP-type peptidyl-prolyl cis-trans isomerase FklB
MRLAWMAAFLWIALTATIVGAVEQKAQTAPAGLTTDKEKISYGIGMNIGRNIKEQGVEVDPQIVARGISDALSGAKALMTDEQIKETLTAFQKQLMAKQQAERSKVGQKNAKEGEAFLAQNKTKPGVVTLPSGLQYKILQAGTGPKPKATDKVTTHYRGKLLNGKEFDSSYSRNEPATFQLNGVIPGWTEALQLMPVGSKWELVIPPSLAYGEKGAGDVIGPNSTLIFEVELLSIGEPKKEEAPQTKPQKQ